ncbi:MAG: hypothetical protein EXS01_00805 [Phycisphaerales bacterium]|nr:hypothetical protein [Phycisphaerales bacterium]
MREHRVERINGCNAVQFQRNEFRGIHPREIALCQPARNHLHADYLLDVLDRLLGWRLVEIDRDLGVQKREQHVGWL